MTASPQVLPPAPPPEARAATPRRRRRAGLRWLGRAGRITAVALVTLVGAGALAVQRPLALPFVADRIGDVLAREMGRGVTASVGAASLEATGRGLTLRVHDLGVRDAQGRAVVRSPLARVDLDPLALLTGRVAPRRVTLVGLQVMLRVDPSGRVLVSADEAEPAPSAPGPGSGDPLAAVRQAAGALRSFGAGEGPLGGLASVTVEGGRLVVDDLRSGRRGAAEDLGLTFDGSDPAEPRLTASALSRHGRWRLALASHRGEGGARSLEVDVGDLGLGDLAAALGAPEPLDPAARVTASAGLDLDPAGEPSAARARLSLGATRVPVPDAGPLAVDEAALDLAWDRARGGRVRELSLRAGETRGTLAGPIEEAPDAGAAPGTRWRVALRGADAALAGEGTGAAPLRFTAVSLDALADFGARALVVERFALEGEGARMDLTARVALDAADRPGLDLTLRAGRTDGRAAMRLWPPFVSTDARRYIDGALKGGTLTALDIAVRLPPDALADALGDRPVPDESVAVTFATEGVTFALAPGVPPLRGGVATGRVTGRAAAITVPRATMVLPSGRQLALSEGTFEVPNFSARPAEGRAAARAQGPLDAAVELLASPGLKGIANLDADPASVKGSADARLVLTLPLVASLAKEDVRVRGEAQLAGVAVDRLVGKERLEAGALTVTTDRGAVAVKGRGELFGVPATIDYRTRAEGKAGEAVIAFALDDAARAKRGVNLGPGLRGPVGVTITAATGARAEPPVIALDLTRTAIDDLVPGWQKPAGRPARAKFSLRERGGGHALENVEIEGAGLSARGAVDLGADGALTGARLTSIKLSPGDNARLDVERAGAGLKATIRGASFDARPFLKGAGGEGAGAAGGAGALPARDLDLDLKVGQLLGHNGEAVAGAELRLARRGGRLTGLDLNGRLGRAPVSARVAGRAGGAGAVLVLETPDAGAALRYADVYNRMVGGVLTLQLGVEEGKQDGVLLVRDFALRGEPALRRLLADGQGGGERDEAPFTKMRADFVRRAGRLDIREAVMWGDSIGGTVAGSLDTGRDRVNLTGTYVPAYALNNLFAQVPIVGRLLGGGQYEGLFAVSFAVTGKASAPTLQVSPLSAVAPGFLRKIFEFRGEATGSAAPPAAPRDDAR